MRIKQRESFDKVKWNVPRDCIRSYFNTSPSLSRRLQRAGSSSGRLRGVSLIILGWLFSMMVQKKYKNIPIKCSKNPVWSVVATPIRTPGRGSAGGGVEVISQFERRGENLPCPENIRMLPVDWLPTGHEPDVQDRSRLELDTLRKCGHRVIYLLCCLAVIFQVLGFCL